MSFYRGDDFGANPQVPDTPVPDPGFEQTSIATYANTPESAIRAQELATGQAVAGSGFFGGGGFLQELGDVAKTFTLFFTPFVPFIAPAILSTELGAAASAAYATEEKIRGALRPTTEAITTALAATTTGAAVTSSPISPARPVPPSPVLAPSSGISYQVLGPPPGLSLSDLASLGLQAAPPRALRAVASRRLSSRQRKALLAVVRNQLQR